MDAAYDLIRELGIDELMLYLMDGNDEALRFYERRGFALLSCSSGQSPPDLRPLQPVASRPSRERPVSARRRRLAWRPRSDQGNGVSTLRDAAESRRSSGWPLAGNREAAPYRAKEE